MKLKLFVNGLFCVPGFIECHSEFINSLLSISDMIQRNSFNMFQMRIEITKKQFLERHKSGSIRK